MLTLWCAYFFRDPERVIPQDDDLILSPADGRVSSVAMVVPRGTGTGQRTAAADFVFMNVFDCHVNRSPVRGRITQIVYRPGQFINAELDKASSDNERNGLVIESKHGKVGVVQIAGLVARRILCFAHPNEPLDAGERFGLIRFGSRLDVYVPQAVRRVSRSASAPSAAKPCWQNSVRPRADPQPPQLKKACRWTSSAPGLPAMMTQPAASLAGNSLR